MLPEALTRFRRPIILIGHVGLIPAVYLLAFALRFDFDIPAAQWGVFLATLPLLLACRFGAFAAFGLFRGWWRHAGIHDLVDLARGVTISTLAFVMLLFLTGFNGSFPRSILFLDWALALLVFGGLRLSVRCAREGIIGARPMRAGETPVLVIGAGVAGERLLRELERSPDRKIFPVGLVDDDPAKQGMQLHGVRVLGTTETLTQLADRSGARLLVIAIPSSSRRDLQRVVDRCLETGVDFRIVPSLREMLEGRARFGELRKVEIEDLLGRPSVQLDLSAVESDLEGRTVLVTGGAGSIGSELARQIAVFGPRKLLLIEQAESPLYFLDLELRGRFPGLEITPIVADITDRRRMKRIFAEHRPDRVFHAAAYKHVPLMEGNVVEAVRNNVQGTLHLAEVAAAHGVERFVLISTDKAVNPSSVMGATKRVAERVVLGWPALRTSGTDFRVVRFGNVLGSDGSVIPLFRRQLDEGLPLTVTHRDVTRYFMTIPEAAQLVLQAGAIPEAAGRISMLDMGEPVRILDLAENLVRLSGMEPYTDVPIVFTGLRPGEKIAEELMSAVEHTVPTRVEKIRMVETDEADPRMVSKRVESLLDALESGNETEVLLDLCALVPERVEPLSGIAGRATAHTRAPSMPAGTSRSRRDEAVPTRIPA
jgi:FlaA1/EpsC-like NDP-sugar epimerase